MRHAYYRRCHCFRANGEQCKAPALKGSNICYKHTEQASTALRRRQSLEELALPETFADISSIQRALHAAAQALIDGRIDQPTAASIILRLQHASQALNRPNEVIPQQMPEEN